MPKHTDSTWMTGTRILVHYTDTDGRPHAADATVVSDLGGERIRVRYMPQRDGDIGELGWVYADKCTELPAAQQYGGSEYAR